MAEFQPDTVTWNVPSKSWNVELAQLSTAPANLGISAYPYVYKVFLELSSFPKTNTPTIKAIILAAAKAVRPASPSDLILPDIDALVTEVIAKLTYDWYAGLGYTEVSLASGETIGSAADYASYKESDAALVNTVDGFTMKLVGALPVRVETTEHMPLSGWYYFRSEDLAASFISHDAAVSVQEAFKHYLTWNTKTDSTSTYKPLSAGVMSVTPARTLDIGGTAAHGLVAGDILRVNVSGGSGEYTATAPASLELVGLNTWRVITNATAELSLVFTDINIPLLTSTITVNTILK